MGYLIKYKQNKVKEANILINHSSIKKSNKIPNKDKYNIIQINNDIKQLNNQSNDIIINNTLTNNDKNNFLILCEEFIQNLGIKYNEYNLCITIKILN